MRRGVPCDGALCTEVSPETRGSVVRACAILGELSPTRKLSQRFAVAVLKVAVTCLCSRITGQVKMTFPVSAFIRQVDYFRVHRDPGAIRSTRLCE